MDSKTVPNLLFFHYAVEGSGSNVYEVALKRVAPVIKAQCEHLPLYLNRDVLSTVFEYLDLKLAPQH